MGRRLAGLPRHLAKSLSGWRGMPGAPVFLTVFLSLGLAPAVPWAPGEQLDYRFTWQGITVGEFRLSAESVGTGYRYSGRLEPQGMAAWLGFGLEAESVVGADLFTQSYQMSLTEPFKGTTLLSFSKSGKQGKGKVIHPDGSMSSWSSLENQVLDELSVLYFLRVNPELKQLSLVDYPGLAQGKLVSLGKDSQGRAGYRFEQEGYDLEAWYRAGSKRILEKLVVKRDFGHMEAELIK
ncbi:MAG: DUF3108 domain-containing protein [Deinococcus sp.]|nr:DUF3108 domain-containing protein [Deinococcus sp.]